MGKGREKFGFLNVLFAADPAGEGAGAVLAECGGECMRTHTHARTHANARTNPTTPTPQPYLT